MTRGKKTRGRRVARRFVIASTAFPSPRRRSRARRLRGRRVVRFGSSCRATSRRCQARRCRPPCRRPTCARRAVFFAIDTRNPYTTPRPNARRPARSSPRTRPPRAWARTRSRWRRRPRVGAERSPRSFTDSATKNLRRRSRIVAGHTQRRLLGREQRRRGPERRRGKRRRRSRSAVHHRGQRTRGVGFTLLDAARPPETRGASPAPRSSAADVEALAPVTRVGGAVTRSARGGGGGGCGRPAGATARRFPNSPGRRVQGAAAPGDSSEVAVVDPRSAPRAVMAFHSPPNLWRVCGSVFRVSTCRTRTSNTCCPWRRRARAVFVTAPRPSLWISSSCDPPFLPMLYIASMPFTISELLRRRSVRFALGLRHLELCLEQERRLDPRRETLEVFPAGALLVVDGRARLIQRRGDRTPGDRSGIRRRRRRRTAAGEFHYGVTGVREGRAWPWAIKVHQGIFHSLMVQKHKAQRAPALPTPEGKRRSRTGGVAHRGRAKALTSLRHQGDRSVRGARLLGITWEESSHEEVDEPPQAVRDAVKIAAKHAALCRAVFFVTEDPKTIAAAQTTTVHTRVGRRTAPQRSSKNSSRRCGGRRSPRARRPRANGVGSRVGRAHSRRRRRRSKLLLRPAAAGGSDRDAI